MYNKQVKQQLNQGWQRTSHVTSKERAMLHNPKKISKAQPVSKCKYISTTHHFLSRRFQYRRAVQIHLGYKFLGPFGPNLRLRIIT